MYIIQFQKGLKVSFISILLTVLQLFFCIFFFHGALIMLGNFRRLIKGRKEGRLVCMCVCMKNKCSNKKNLQWNGFSWNTRWAQFCVSAVHLYYLSSLNHRLGQCNKTTPSVWFPIIMSILNVIHLKKSHDTPYWMRFVKKNFTWHSQNLVHEYLI